MELKDFITETLVQMMEGVKNAQKKAEEFGAIVNPESLGGDSYIEVGNNQVARIQEIEFEVALTETSETGTHKGIGVAFSGIGAKGNKDKNEQNISYNKIRFNVPIALPFVSCTDPYKEK